MERQIEMGIFLPIGSEGFFISERTPHFSPTFEMNKQISQMAESFGFDYVFSMCKWRGFGGKTEFWDHTLESLTLMTGLAVATSRIKVIATVNPLCFNPAIAAKMIATLDEISGGRCGINIITGASPAEYQQMGIWPEGYDTGRYRYAEEWVTALKRLWSEDRVDYEGDFFRLRDCVSSPKPVQQPHPFLVCAGVSQEGFSFTARHCDYSFLGGSTTEETNAQSRRMKATARPLGREVKTAATLAVIQAESDEAAEALFDYYFEGADTEALANIMGAFGGQAREASRDRASRMRESICFAGRPVVGGPETIASTIRDLAVEGDLDNILLIFPDYIEGLRAFQRDVMPLLQEQGLRLPTAA